MRFPAAALASLVLLAGCADDAAPADDRTAEAEGRSAVEAGAHVPTWSVGDAWAWTAPYGDYTLVVREVTGTDYIIGTDNPDIAFFDARFPVSSMGAQRRSDLAGSQGLDRVKFFDWPLQDGKTWTTRWDGNDYAVTAREVSGGRFEMTARMGDTTRVEYTYDPAVRWFRELTFYDENGTEPTTATMRQHSTNWTGNLVSWTFEVVDDQVIDDPTPYATTYTPPEATDLFLEVALSCSEPGLLLFALGPAESAPDIATGGGAAGYSAEIQCPDTVVDGLAIAEAPFEGHWGVVCLGASQDARVAFTLFARTQTLTPVGS